MKRFIDGEDRRQAEPRAVGTVSRARDWQGAVRTLIVAIFSFPPAR
jgi:hypothetical protein